MPDRNISAPPTYLATAEPWRSAAELAGLWLSAPMLALTQSRGDGHSVLVLPGFGATDASTLALRGYLDFIGYRSATWALGRNLGYHTLGEAEERLRARIREIYDKSGGRVSLIGWSLGGVMARHMAREHPELVRQVITLAAPFTGNPAATNVRSIYELFSGENLDCPDVLASWRENRLPPPVPTTSIYSKSDGICAWQNCLEVETSLAENVEVSGSHIGMPHNPVVFGVIASRLAREETPIARAGKFQSKVKSKAKVKAKR